MGKRRVDRYVVFEAFARGGMASVHLGRLVADRGFSRLVAIKMLTHGKSSSLYARALEEEARIASRIRHPNVVQPLDFVVDGDDLFVVMEYVHGVALSRLIAASGATPMPREVVVAIMTDVLKGLHAAHEAVDERGRPLGVVHRDVSPQNVLVGADGVARLADFGIAKVMHGGERTQTGIVKGKLAYMPPEQLRGLPLTRQADIFSAGAVLAQALSGLGPTAVQEDPTAWLAPSVERIDHPALLDVVRGALHPEPRDRWATAAEMGAALASAMVPARADEVADRVTALAGDELDLRSELVRRVEAEPLDSIRPGEMPPTEASPAPEPDPELELSTPVIVRAPPARSSPPSAARRTRTTQGRGLFVLLGTAVVLVGAVAWARFGRRPPAPDSPPAWPAPPVLPAEGVTSDSNVESAAATSDPPIASVTAEPRSSSGSPRPSGRTKRRPKPAAVGAPQPDCNPPFRIDAEGKKHYKPECLE